AGAKAPGSSPVRLAGQKVRVLLVYDHKMVRDGLSLLLQEEADLEVVGMAADGESAMTLVRQLLPEVVVMDVNLPGMSGIEVTRSIVKVFPRIKVIGLSMFEEPEVADAMRQAGASAYTTKSGPPGALVLAIRSCVGVEVADPAPPASEDPARRGRGAGDADGP
ncbi:MAG: response regulator transcription factor, partial [Candidatus Riflebacteria bacterium]|nr:response regulator transcription factor [Candidatus Riflebacteria bacterium]